MPRLYNLVLIREARENSRENKNAPRKALFPLPPTGSAHFFCEKIWVMKTTLAARPAGGLGGLGGFSQNEKNFSFWKRFFANDSGRWREVKNGEARSRAVKYGFGVLSRIEWRVLVV